MSQHRAVRRQGLCYGSMWKEHKDATDVDSRGRSRSLDFCVVVGNLLLTYESFHAFRRGDLPLSDVRIVGASAWNPTQTCSHPSHLNLARLQHAHTRSRSLSPLRADGNRGPPTASTVGQLAASLSSSAAAALFGEPAGNLSFRIITFSGTHLECMALSSEDKDTWLASIMAGLHLSLSGYSDALSMLGQRPSIHNHLPLTSQQQALLQLYECNKLTPPLPRTNEAPMDYASLHPILHTIVNTSTSAQSDFNFTSHGQAHFCTSCGKLTPTHMARPTYLYGIPLVQYGLENKISSICYPCLIAQGLLRHVMTLVDLYAADAMDWAARIHAKQLVLDHVHACPEHDTQDTTNQIMLQRILALLHTPAFVTLRRQSQKLDQASLWLQRRIQMLFRDSPTSIITLEEIQGYLAEFMDFLNQHNGSRSNHTNQRQHMGDFKKEALKVAGDMGTAIKLLYEYAIPQLQPDNHGDLEMVGNGELCHGSIATEMFSSILDFFLDLCRDGDIASVAFYWPQICQIHLQMLPPLDIESLSRVELMEDFLITVSTKYSVHLALELVWNSLADLEESLGTNRDSATASCRRRKFALLRFVCELESYIFDFDGGWGGGSISLRGLLTPSEDQGTLIRAYMGYLQMHRQFVRYSLTCSTRLEKLLGDSRENMNQSDGTNDSGDLLLQRDDHAHARRKMNLARNAAYFHSQIIFTRRLGDIAEKLRFLDIEARLPTLHHEIDQLNSCGHLGGDPINKIVEVNRPLTNVLQIPTGECHVFRSKARTPILLLMEMEHEKDICNTSFVGNQLEPLWRSGSSEYHSLQSDHDGIMDTVLGSNLSYDDTTTICNSIHLSTDPLDSLQLTPRRRLASSNDSFAHQRVEKFVTKIIGDKFNYAIPQLVTGNNHHEEEEEVFYDAAADRTTFLSKASSSDAYDFTMPPTRGDNAPAVHTNLQTGLQERLSSVDSETSVHQCSTPSLFKMKRTGIKDMASRTFNIYGEGRRQVLTTIFMKGMKSPNLIARSVAPAAQRAAQAIDAHLAVNLLLRDREKNRRRDQEKISESMCDRSYEDSKEYALSLAMKASLEVEQEDSVNYSSLSSSDECMESLRLLLIRDRIAKGLLSLEGAAKVLYASQNSGSNSSNGELSSSFQEENSIAFEPNGDVVEAGNLDARLSGCGAVGPAVASSIRMWKEGVITDTELLDLVQKDTVFSRMSFPGKENESKLQEDSAFWEKFAFGELWAQKKARIQSSSRFGTVTGWDLCGVIVKSNDDVRQEAFVMQLIELCKEIFDQAGLDVWLQPYRILATSKSTGILEMVRNAMSIDSLKKRPGFSKGGLLGHFERMAQVAADPCEALMTSKRNFVRSLAAYSLISYLFNIKDRHNAPGGTFSLEQSVPFKLTDEMIQVMDGVGSKLFLDFLMLFCCGFVALQMHADTFLTLVEITCAGSTFKCFEGRDHTEILENLRSRFCLHLSKETTISFAMDLIYQATTTNGTARYDFFQYISNGIAT